MLRNRVDGWWYDHDNWLVRTLRPGDATDAFWANKLHANHGFVCDVHVYAREPEYARAFDRAQTIKIRIDWDAAHDNEMSLTEFFEVNVDGIDEAEQDDIRKALVETGVYHGGGGAAAEWCIRIVS